MLRKGTTLREAAEIWVNGFNAIHTSIIEKLWEIDTEDWCEITCPVIGDRVYASDIGEGEVVKVNLKNRRCAVELNDGNIIWLDNDQVEIENESLLPMWGTMWSFGDNLDDYWLEEKNGIQQMSQCGFRIYKSEEYGYYFGIDGAGYDFYEQHWIPLYKKRGLKWHDPRTEVKS